MGDILDDARETLAEITALRHGQTHYAGCRRVHTGCLIAAMIREIERLRLTDAEREAIIAAAGLLNWCDKNGHIGNGGLKDLETLRGLLDRMKNSTRSATF